MNKNRGRYVDKSFLQRCEGNDHLSDWFNSIERKEKKM
jgi:hypothetical protein